MHNSEFELILASVMLGLVNEFKVKIYGRREQSTALS